MSLNSFLAHVSNSNSYNYIKSIEQKYKQFME